MRCVSSTEKSDGMVDDTFQNREAIRTTPRASGKLHDKGTATGARPPRGRPDPAGTVVAPRRQWRAVPDAVAHIPRLNAYTVLIRL